MRLGQKNQMANFGNVQNSPFAFFLPFCQRSLQNFGGSGHFGCWLNDRECDYSVSPRARRSAPGSGRAPRKER